MSAAVLAGAVAVSGLNLTGAYAASAAALPACKHFSDVVPPNRPAGPSHNSLSQGPRVSLDGRLPAPGAVTGTFDGSKVTITFNRVAGARAYRVWRNAQAVAWVSDFGQPALVATDSGPCRQAYYTIVAMRDESGSDAAMGALSTPYRLQDGGTIAAAPLAAGTTFSYTITSYNDGGQTASGFDAGLGKCAVDARFIPMGTRLRVDGYGLCLAVDIGLWIQGPIVDVWLPGNEANDWGVQQRTITIVT